MGIELDIQGGGYPSLNLAIPYYFITCNMSIEESNKTSIITVSEPYDFTNSNEGNIIRGEIINIVEDNCLIFKTNNILNFDDIKGDILVLFVRSGNINSFLDFGTRISINGGFLLTEYHSNLSIDFLKENSKFVLIGTLTNT